RGRKRHCKTKHLE
nr:Chain E, Peptide from E3 ubiquitin-protein ligase RNF169 [Homo sapiens]5GG4_F Chain F, Peptide from E3 ubiquitin-protein ligase RNF169 [Homo sapiens]5GG4_G Chain G, Peptide from E3 ubiquitin-protein ligase RNF169 [Homo sapiens]5GG4_H Chain H, Peptide from E3 ubiquitin-protein ligase RNF169 [Homo sapiens]